MKYLLEFWLLFEFSCVHQHYINKIFIFKILSLINNYFWFLKYFRFIVKKTDRISEAKNKGQVKVWTISFLDLPLQPLSFCVQILYNQILSWCSGWHKVVSNLPYDLNFISWFWKGSRVKLGNGEEDPSGEGTQNWGLGQFLSEWMRWWAISPKWPW